MAEVKDLLRKLIDDARRAYEAVDAPPEQSWLDESERDQRRDLLRTSGVDEAITAEDSARIVGGGVRDTVAMRSTASWFRGNQPVLYMHGGFGSGKTVASAWVLSRKPGLFITAHRLLRLFTGRYGDVLNIQDRVRTAGALVIDDVGREPPGESAVTVAALEEVLDRRRSHGRRTIITSNLTYAQFGKRYPSGALASRLAQSASIVHAAGPDLRSE